MEIKINKVKIAELKAMNKFTGRENYNLNYLVYNGKDQKFEVSNGKIAIMVDCPIDNLTDNYYKVIILKESIMLTEIDSYPDLSRIYPTMDLYGKKGEFIHNGKTDIIDTFLSIFLSEIEECYNYKYLLNLPKCDKYDYYKMKHYDENASLFIGEISLGKIKVLVMPIVKSKYK